MDLVPGTEGVPSIPLVPVNLGYFRNASGEMEKISLGVREIESRLFITVPMPGVEKSLPVLECKTQGKGSCEFDSPQPFPLVLNFPSFSPAATTTLRLARDTTTLWDDQIPSRAIAAISNGEYTAVSTEDGGLWTWTQAGRRLLPCITLEGPASFLVLEGDLLMAVSSVGGIDIWWVAASESARLCFAKTTCLVPQEPEGATVASFQHFGRTRSLGSGHDAKRRNCSKSKALGSTRPPSKADDRSCHGTARRDTTCSDSHARRVPV